jgi:hypothetical protein
VVDFERVLLSENNPPVGAFRGGFENAQHYLKSGITILRRLGLLGFETL